MEKILNFCPSGQKPAFIIECGSCGRRSMVSAEHRRYCPVCGPDVVVPIRITEYAPEAVTEQRIAEGLCSSCEHKQSAACAACFVSESLA